MSHRTIRGAVIAGMFAALAILLCIESIPVSAAGGKVPPMESIEFPIIGGKGGIGFDDMGYSTDARRVMAPAGRIGAIALIDPFSLKFNWIPGFTRSAKPGLGHDDSVTSASSGPGFMLATDRTARRLYVVNMRTGKFDSYVPLAGGPDYVRYVAPTQEAWVTEPEESRIEVFSLSRRTPPVATHSRFIDVPGGPESLVINVSEKRAYTNLWKDATEEIDLTSGKTTRWPNGCAGSRGLAIDPARDRLFVGCAEGKLSVLDSKTGKQLGAASSGSGVDIIAYNPNLAHVYMPGAKSGTMAVVGIDDYGAPKVLGTAKTPLGAHCVAADFRQGVYVCDPRGGKLLYFLDFYPASI
jgi:hypothetical protein